MKVALERDGVEIQTFDLDEAKKKSFVVGRSDDADVRIDDRAVGREHAVISLTQSRIQIQKKSKFGKFAINGVELGEGTLREGDVVDIASYRVRVLKDAVVPPASPAAHPEAVSMAISGRPEIEMAPLGTPPLGTSLDSSSSPPLEAGSELAIEASIGASPVASSGGISDPAIAVDAPVVDPGQSEFASSPSIDLGTEPSAGTNSGEGASVGLELNTSASSTDSGDKTAMIPATALLAKLVFKDGEANVKELLIRKPEVSIGRGTTCDVVLSDKKASRKHLVIKRSGNQFVARDMGSANGTYVNGQKISDRELAGDDVIRIGDTEFGFKAVSQDYVEQAQAQSFLTVPVEESAPADDVAGNVAVGLDLGMASPMGEPQNIMGQAVIPSAAPFDNVSAGPQPTAPNAGGGNNKDFIGNFFKNFSSNFKKQPPMRRILFIATAVIVALAALQDDFLGEKKPDAKKKSTTVDGADKANASFDALPQEKKQFVTNTYTLAVDYFRKEDFDKVIYEVGRIHEILPGGYRDSKDYLSYAQRAAQRVKSREEERKRREAEEKLKAEVDQLVHTAETLVEQRKHDEAKVIFAQILEKDPENTTVLRLKQIIEERDQKARLEAAEKQERMGKEDELRALLARGRGLLKRGDYYGAIDLMADAPNIFVGNPELIKEARNIVATAKKTLIEKTRPYLTAGEDALINQDFTAARDHFLAALRADYKNVQAKRGLDRVRTVLREKAKVIYTQAVIAESLSDYRGAYEKFLECQKVAMPEDVYFDRCSRMARRFDVLYKQSDSGPKPASVHPEGE